MKKENPEIEVDGKLVDEAVSSLKKDQADKASSDQNEAPSEPSKEENDPQEIDYYDRFIRLSADFDNFRKRNLKERTDYIKYGNEALLKEMLPILDNFERALGSATQDQNNSILQGVEMIYGQMMQLLEKFGLKAKSCLGQPFNPAFHEAMNHIETNEEKPNTVIEEHQKMYMYHEKLIRPALVSVSKSKEEE